MADSFAFTLDVDVPAKNIPKLFYVKLTDIKSKKDELKKELDSLVKNVHDTKSQCDITYEMEELKVVLHKVDSLLNTLNSEISNEIKKDSAARTEVEKKVSTLSQDVFNMLPSVLTYRKQIPLFSAKLADLTMRDTMKIVENLEIKLLQLFSKVFIYREMMKLSSASSEINTLSKELSGSYKKVTAKSDKNLKSALNEPWKNYETGIEHIHQSMERILSKISGLIKKGFEDNQIAEIRKHAKSFRSDEELLQKYDLALRSKATPIMDSIGEAMDKIMKLADVITLAFNNIVRAYEELEEITVLCKQIEKFGEQFSEKFDDMRIDSVCCYIPESSSDVNHLDNMKYSITSAASVAFLISKSKTLKLVDPEISQYWDKLKDVMYKQWTEVLGERLEQALKLFENAKGWSTYIGELFCIKYLLSYVHYVARIEDLQLQEQHTRILDFAILRYNNMKGQIKDLTSVFSVGKDEDEFVHLILGLQKEMQNSYLDAGKRLQEKRIKYLHTVCFSSYTQQLTLLEEVLKEKEVVVNRITSNTNKDVTVLEIGISQCRIMVMEIEAFYSILENMKAHVATYLGELIDAEKVQEIKRRIEALVLLIQELLKKLNHQIESSMSVLAVGDVKKEADKLLMMASVVQSAGEDLLNTDHSHPVINLTAKSQALLDLISENNQKTESLVKTIIGSQGSENECKVDIDTFTQEVDQRHKKCEKALRTLKDSLSSLEKYQLFEKHSRKLCLWLSFMVKMMNHGGLGGSLTESSCMYKIHLETYKVVQNIDKLVSAIQEKAEDMIMSGNPCSHSYRKSVQSINECQNQLLIAFYYRESNLESAITLYNWISEISLSRSWVKNLVDRMDSVAETTDETILTRDFGILEEYFADLKNKREFLNQLIASEKLLKYPITITEKTSTVLIGTENYTSEVEFEMPIVKDHVYFLICEYDKNLILISDGCRNGYASMQHLRQDCCSSDISHQLCSFPTWQTLQEAKLQSKEEIDSACMKVKDKITRINDLRTQCHLMNQMEGLNLWIEAKKKYFVTELSKSKDWEPEMMIQKLTCLKMELIKKKTSLISLGKQCVLFKEKYSRPEFEELKVKVETNFASLDASYAEVINSCDDEVRIAIDSKILLYWLSTMRKQYTQLEVMMGDVEKAPDLKKMKENIDKINFLVEVVETQFNDWLIANPGKSGDENSIQLEQVLEKFHKSYARIAAKIDEFTKLNDFVVIINPSKILLMSNQSEFNQRYDLNECDMFEVRKNAHKDYVESTMKSIDSLNKLLKDHEYLLKLPYIESKATQEFDVCRYLISSIEDSISDKDDYMNDYVSWNNFRQLATTLLQWMKSKEEVFTRCDNQTDDAAKKTLKRTIEIVRNKKPKYDEIIDLSNELIMAETFAKDEITKLQQACKVGWVNLQKLMYSCKFTFLSEKNLKNMAYKIDQQTVWLTNRLKQFAESPKFDFEEFENQRHSFDLLVSDSNGNLANISAHISSLNDLFQYVDISTAGTIPEKLKRLQELSDELKSSIRRQKEAFEGAGRLADSYSKVCSYIVMLEEIEHKLSRCTEPNVSRMHAKLDLIKNGVCEIEANLERESSACESKTSEPEAIETVTNKTKSALDLVSALRSRIEQFKQLYLSTGPVETANTEMDQHHDRLVQSVLYINQVKHNETDNQQKISEILTIIGNHINAEKTASVITAEKIAQAETCFEKLNGLCDDISKPEDQENLKQMLKAYRAIFDNKKAALDKIREEFERAQQEVNSKYSGALSAIQSNLALSDLEDWSMKKLKALTEMPDPVSEQTLALIRVELEETEKQLREKEVMLKNQEENTPEGVNVEDRAKILESVRTNLDLIKKRINENKIKCEVYEAECMYDKNFGAIDAWIVDKTPSIPTHAAYALMDLSMVESEKANIMVLQDNLKSFQDNHVSTADSTLQELIGKYPHAEDSLKSKFKELMSRWTKFNERLTQHFKSVEGAQKSQYVLDDLMQRFAKLASQLIAGYDSITEKFATPADSLSEEEYTAKKAEFDSLMDQHHSLKIIYDDLLNIQEQIEEIYADARNPHTWYTIESIAEMWNSLTLLTVEKKAEYAREMEKIYRRMADEARYTQLIKVMKEEMEECQQRCIHSGWTLEALLDGFQVSVTKLKELAPQLEELCELEFQITLHASSMIMDQPESSGYLSIKNQYHKMKNRCDSIFIIFSTLVRQARSDPNLKAILEEAANILKANFEKTQSPTVEWSELDSLMGKCTKLIAKNEKSVYIESVHRIVKVYQLNESTYKNIEPSTFLTICMIVYKALNTGFSTTKDILDAFMEVSQGDGKISEFDMYQALGRELAEFCLARARTLNVTGDELDLLSDGFDYETFCNAMFTIES